MTEIEGNLGYRFADAELLRTALRHRSAARHSGGRLADNERLEFLGDAVLGVLISEALLRLLPDAGEGRLTKIKARLVSAEGLAEVAALLKVGDSIELSPAEESNGGRSKRNILSDAVEALVAAVYLDGGHPAAAALVERLFLTPERVAAAAENLAVDNAKSTLQELLQSRQQPPPVYRVLAEDGPPHDRTFRVEVDAGEAAGEILRVHGEGRTKREAEQQAAREALRRFDPAES